MKKITNPNRAIERIRTFIKIAGYGYFALYMGALKLDSWLKDRQRKMKEDEEEE